MRSLKARFALLLGSTALLVVLAALGALWSIGAAERTIDRTLAAQGRLELLVELSGRMSQYGLAALEAMACGVPVVSSDIGGLPELNVDGETGYLCPLADVDAHAAATRRILEDDTLHARMAEAARARAETFALDRIVPLYEAHYDRVRERAGVGV